MDADAAEKRVAAFWTDYADSGRGRLRFAVTRPGRVREFLRARRALPQLEASPSDTPGGRAVARVLGDRGLVGVDLGWTGPAVLDLPDDPATYLLGRSKQTLRRKIRQAEQHGLTWRLVDDAVERTRLLAIANAAEQAHLDPTYRVTAPRNDDLLDHDLWMVVEDPTGAPCLLAVIPTDDAWATLRYFRRLGPPEPGTDGRYLGTAALVEVLAGRGVRHLLDTEHPGAQTNGLRHFQRMVGFRYARVRHRG
ncbi:hypothetical protein [Nocardioides sp. SYSU D00038]|uniref:hypothetical protein n=1 Tax=Nocardioides sp. SYSU D00038 TaxID=2812554 RepID=UPI001967E727|nr:hypothetical protein [Nocardioides sp. SYSU D00038]